MKSCHLARAAGLAVSFLPVAAALAQHQHAPRRNDGDAIVPDGEGCGKALAAQRAFEARTQPHEDPVGFCMACDAEADTDVLHCDLDIEIIPATSTISGSNTFTIKSNINGLTSFTFRLRNQFVISAATINGSAPAIIATPTTTTRIATLDRAYDAGEIFTLRIDYSGVPVSAGSFGSVAFTTQNGQPLFQTLSEPYYAYTWWPCKDGDVATVGDNSDKFTATVAITAPDPIKAVSNGLLQGSDPLSGSRTKYRWATNYPLTTYLIFVGATNYTQWQQTYTYPLSGGGNGTMPVHFSVYPANDTPSNRAAWEACLQMLATYRPIFGEYPFVNEKYGIYNFNFSGGEEHQTYTGQGTFSESVTAHELGHQWWGDNVTCKTWPDIWLNEGFATYSEALWLERKPGSTGLPALHAAMAARRPTQTSGTVYRTDVSSASTIFSSNYAYRKGAWVLHMLRKIVGDATFFDILAAYRAQYQDSAATTNEFAAVCSAVYGQDLSWFFQEWVFEGGAVAYASGWQTVNVAGQDYLRLRLRQTQTATFGVFLMPVDVRIDLVGGGSLTATVWNDALTQWFLIPIPAPASGIAVDEFNWILATAKTSEAYVNGPPKLVASSVTPGQALASAPPTVVLTFSENVTASAADFELIGPGGPVALGLNYNAASFAATLTPSGALSPGAYTLTIRDSLRSVAASAMLDGELVGPSYFPSGNGQPGGAATLAFSIAGTTCYANCDGSSSAPVLNVNDFICFQNLFAAGDPAANCDASTTPPVLNVNDFVCFSNAFAAGCP